MSLVFNFSARGTCGNWIWGKRSCDNVESLTGLLSDVACGWFCRAVCLSGVWDTELIWEWKSRLEWSIACIGGRYKGGNNYAWYSVPVLRATKRIDYQVIVWYIFGQTT